MSTETTAPNPSVEPEPEGGDELAKLQSDLDRFRDLALRSQADLENFRKRAARDKVDAI